MLLVAAVDWRHYMFMIPLILLSIFLVLVILVQRGRGGGLTGALGGMGGQSAFGTKAGDLFTRITIIVAAIWVLLSMASLKVLNQQSATAGLSPSERGQAAPTAPASGTGTGLFPKSDKAGDDKAAAPENEKGTEAPAAPSGTNSDAAAPPAAGAAVPAATTGEAPAAPAAAPPADAPKP